RSSSLPTVPQPEHVAPDTCRSHRDPLVPAVCIESSYAVALHPMPFKKCVHIFVAYELGSLRLAEPFPDRRSRLVIELYRLRSLCRYRQEDFGRLVLIGLGQLAHFPNRFFEHFGHEGIIAQGSGQITSLKHYSAHTTTASTGPGRTRPCSGCGTRCRSLPARRRARTSPSSVWHRTRSAPER